MLLRQKTILRMLKKINKPVDRLALFKMAFLIHHETLSKGGNTFYDFLPYHFGPYSFTLKHDIDKFIKKGLVQKVGEQQWAITSNVKYKDLKLDKAIQADVDAIIQKFSNITTDELLDYVYKNYNWYTVNSIRQQLAKRPTGKNILYTAGYEKLSVEAFLDDFMHSGVEHIIDVRANPVARRFGFHKSTLLRLAGNLGLKYTHLPQLGIPSELRCNLESLKDYQSLFAKYEKTVLPNQKETLAKLTALTQKETCVLICMEADPDYCHRTCVAEAISANTQLPTTHLRALA